jgi:hypothetical protein
MEVRQKQYHGSGHWRVLLLMVLLPMLPLLSEAQPCPSRYTIRDGMMLLQLSRDLSPSAIDSLKERFDLKDLPLTEFIRLNNPDSLTRLGWQIAQGSPACLILTKHLTPMEGVGGPVEKIRMAEKQSMLNALYPSMNAPFGSNRLRPTARYREEDSIVYFHLRNFGKASEVKLAGSFTSWKSKAVVMQKTDSGWTAAIALPPGKHWYKYIVDGQWITDPDNLQHESDGRGNINAVYYKSNKRFRLAGQQQARRVFLAGSFNNWDPRALPMNRTAAGWELPIYLVEGTHTYKFVADGNWLPDPSNPDRLPDGAGGFNSVLRSGTVHLFRLKGFPKAGRVILAGSFNGWKEDELRMERTAEGWQLPYQPGPGNHEYRFIVDGRWVTDPDNPLSTGTDGNSILILEPNHVFRLKGFETARKVTIAGDFNDWNPDAFPMRREGGEWVFPLHLRRGKHRYKFVVDGKWILDPANKLWEQNEFNTGNSILWREEGEEERN